MKKLISLMLPMMALLMLSFQTYAGEKVDTDGDGFYCMREDDGLYCDEDDQDNCPTVFNQNQRGTACIFDLNDDGVVDTDDWGYLVNRTNYYSQQCFDERLFAWRTDYVLYPQCDPSTNKLGDYDEDGYVTYLDWQVAVDATGCYDGLVIIPNLGCYRSTP